MKLLEYKGKEILNNYCIPIQKGFIVSKASEIDQKFSEDGCIVKPPFVLKVQVMAGGRGKAGGIRFADDIPSAKKECDDLIGMEIKDHIVEKVLVAEKIDVKNEWYVSVILDRFYKCPMVIFSPMGGVDIEQTAKNDQDKIIKIPISTLTGIKDFHARYIFDKYDLDHRYFEQFFKILAAMYQVFLDYDLTLLEINPLAISEDDALVAIDCKADVDDSALYRHSDILEFRKSLNEDRLIIEARGFNFLYIPLKKQGDVAVMSNGSGMLMSCIDLITQSGGIACAALDLGGGATSDRIAEAVKIVFKNQNTRHLFISIFGGITRCDEVAEGVRLAMTDIPQDRTIVIRLEGTNKARALEIISKMGGNVVFVDSITKGVKALKTRREKI